MSVSSAAWLRVTAHEGLLLLKDWTRTNKFGLGARMLFQHIKDPGMTHTYHGLSRAFPYVELEPIKSSVESFNELVYRITCFRGLSHRDANADDADR